LGSAIASSSSSSLFRILRARRPAAEPVTGAVRRDLPGAARARQNPRRSIFTGV